MSAYRRLVPLLVAAACAAPLVCAGEARAGTPTPVPTPTVSPTDSPSPDPTPTGTPTDSPSPTPTVTPTTTPTSTPTPTTIVATRGNYAPNPADTMRTYAPSDAGLHPAVLFIHGGAWGRSRPNSHEFRFARRLAARHDWVVAVIGYPTKIPREHVIEPQAIRKALTKLVSRGDVDPRAVALWGESSGGQLALLAAYRDAMLPAPIVHAVVSISGPTNMRIEYTSLAQTALGAVTRFEGLTPRQAQLRGSARYRLTSPVNLVRHTDPATFQAISWHDPLVPAVQIADLARRLTAEGVPHETVHIPGDGHSTTIETQRPAGSKHDVAYLATAFLTQVFAKATT